MVRPRRSSAASEESAGTAGNQELGSMYDYLAKIILLGPSGSGKSCILHRFLKNEWRAVSSQTIGVECASKIIRVGTGARRKRIKLQLWDTAGTERFRSVSRSYYRGAAGAILVYDIANHNTFTSLSSFMNDARALASPNLTCLLVGNKLDLADSGTLIDTRDLQGGGGGGGGGSSIPPSSLSSNISSNFPSSLTGNSTPSSTLGLGTKLRATIAPEGREVSQNEASNWASANSIPVSVEVSALSGENVEEIFGRLARMILTKIELGEIDPDDPMSGIQYGDGGWVVGEDGASVKSGMTGGSGAAGTRRRKGKRGGWGLGGGVALGGMREWEEVFTVSGSRRRGGGCC